MCSVKIRQASARRTSLVHPAGVTLPFDGVSAAMLITPKVRGAISAGTYGAEMIAHLPDALREGDRVLVIGAGLGVLSTLIAKTQGVDRVIAVEADTRLIPYLEAVHALNGVPWVETLNAVPGNARRGRAPFFVRRDLRTSSLQSHDGEWQQVMMVPLIDLGLVLSDEQISLTVWDSPTSSAHILAEADLGPVERVLVNGGNDTSHLWQKTNHASSDQVGSWVYMAQILGAAPGGEAFEIIDLGEGGVGSSSLWQRRRQKRQRLLRRKR